MYSFVQLIFVVLAAINFANGAFSHFGNIIVVNGISYYAASDPVATLVATKEQLRAACGNGAFQGLVPITVVETHSGAFTVDVMKGIVQNFSASDDVFNTGFLQGIFP